MAIISYLLPWVLGIAVVLFVITGFIVRHTFRRNLEKNSILEGRWHFAFRTLAVSQIVLFVLLFGFVIITAGFGLFVVPLFAFADVASALLIFIFALIFYSVLRSNTLKIASVSSTPAVQSSSIVSGTVYALIGIAIPLLLFNFLAGDVRRELLDSLYFSTQSTALVETELAHEPPGYRQDELIARLAYLKQDPSICEKQTISYHKNDCYYDADPEATAASKACTLFTKYGDMNFARNKQTRCITFNLIVKKAQTSDLLNCSAMAQQFNDNPGITGLIKYCRLAEILQNAKLNNNPADCAPLLQPDPDKKSSDTSYESDRYYACIGQFVGSTQWKSVCANISTSDSGGLSLAKCPGSDNNYR